MPVFPGSPNDDTLAGSISDDTLQGLAGDDTLFGSAGADEMDGGDDIDTVDYSDAAGSVTVDLDTGAGSGSDAAGDTYVSIENAVGSGLADVLIGNDQDNELDGGAGNDTLGGSAGADTMIGGSGTDTVDYTASAFGVMVDLDNEEGFGGDAIGDVYDSIENAIGSGLDDLLIGDAGANRLDGGNGNDTLAGDLGADTLVGGAGVDTATYEQSDNGVSVNLTSGLGVGGHAQGDVLSAIENVIGSDLNDSLTGSTADNALEGGEGNDTLTGGNGADTLLGGDGDDWIYGGLGNDSIDGGAGINTADFNAATSFVRVNLTTGLTTGGLGSDTIVDIQNVIGSEFNDSLTGNAEDNILVGSDGADTLIGNGGVDTADYTSADTRVSIDLVLGRGFLGVAAGDVLTGIENVTGSAFNDSLKGDDGNNVLAGLADNDSLVGGAGNDTLIGGEGSRDSMTGGLGDDVYFVDNTTDKVVEGNNGGADVVFSSASFTLSLAVEDLILTGTGDLDGTGNSSANQIFGTDGENSLDGGSGNDSIDGGDGNDIVKGGSGIDVMVGGNGDDAYFIDNALDTVSENGTTGHDTVNSTVSWILGTGFEDLTLTGTTGASGTGNADDNVINGNIGSNLLTGNDGNDSIVGDLTDDTLRGGNDTLDGGDGDNTLVGGLGNDTYLITTGNDTLVEDADEGTDTVQTDISLTLGDNIENLVLNGLDNLDGEGNELANVLTGNDGNNDLAGGAEDDTLLGGIGNDTLDGEAGNDSMVGGVGDDEYWVDSEDDVVIEGSNAGFDTVISEVSYTINANIETLIASSQGAINLTGNTLNNQINGNGFSNILSGGTGDDTLIAGGAADTLNGGSGSDSMVGGDGNDSFVVDDLGDETIEEALEGDDTVTASISWTLADFIETLVLDGTSGLSGTGNDLDNLIIGTTGANALSGGAGEDTLQGGAGNDSLSGGSGIDSMLGGTGNDLYTLNQAEDEIIEGLDEGTDTVKVDFDYVLLDNFENLTITGTGDFTGTGNELANKINGNGGANDLTGAAGDDTITGGDGADTIDGGTGADSMSGGAGADTYFVDDLGDRVVETSARQIDLVISEVSFTLGSGVENLQLNGSAADGTGNSVANEMTGNGQNNILLGLGGNDTLVGAGGADSLDGGTGNDNMTGGNGNDTYVVNSLTDVVSEAGSTGTDLIKSSVNYTLGTNQENLTLTGTNRTNATGNALDNAIIGNDGNNKIAGMDGADSLTGGLGADRFVFSDTTSGVDTITDFNGLVSGLADGDKLQFDASLLIGTFAYVGSAAFTAGGVNTEARITSNGRVQVDVDGNGSADIAIIMTGLVTEDQLVVTDFVFV